MAKKKKTLAEKEQELISIISDAKKKLSKLQDHQKYEIGEIACKNGLNEFDITTLDGSFKKLYDTLKNS